MIFCGVFFFVVVALANASFLPVVVQPITNYTNAAPLPCPTACPVTNYSGSAIDDPDWTYPTFINVTTFRKYPNATGDFYQNGTAVRNSSSLTLQNNVMCFAQPSISLWLYNLTALPCSTIQRKQTLSLFSESVSGVATLNDTEVFNAINLASMPHLQQIDATFLNYGALTLSDLPVLRTINLQPSSNGLGLAIISNCSSFPYFNASAYSVAVLYADQNNNLMGVLLKGLGTAMNLENSAAFERFDIANTTDTGGSISIDTKSERFLNSRPNCVGVFTGNVTFFVQYCLPVQNAPPRNPTECPQPIAERCASSEFYNASCWIPEWNVSVFNITTPGTVVKDCVFDANHWFNVSTLYVYDTSIVLPARIQYGTIVYLNTLSPTAPTTLSPTSLSPTTLSPTTKSPSSLSPTSRSPTKVRQILLTSNTLTNPLVSHEKTNQNTHHFHFPHVC